MRENKIRKIWAQGGTVINGWLAIPSSISAELMAQLGWDSICIDMQHGAIDYSDALPMLQAISTTDTTPLIRIPWFDPAIIGKSLDAGAYGIICPMVNNRAEAQAFVAACRYAPQGQRSVGPLRASLYAGADYVKTSTGFGPGGATAADVALMRRVVGAEMGVKAAGGVRDLEGMKAMIAAGATRVGASAGVKIVQQARGEQPRATSSGY